MSHSVINSIMDAEQSRLDRGYQLHSVFSLSGRPLWKSNMLLCSLEVGHSNVCQKTAATTPPLTSACLTPTPPTVKPSTVTASFPAYSLRPMLVTRPPQLSPPHFLPIGFAPIEINNIYHPPGKLPLAKVVDTVGSNITETAIQHSSCSNCI